MPYDLDLSWLFYPYIYTQTDVVSGDVTVGSGNAPNSAYSESPQQLEYQIAQMGIIQALSLIHI